MSRDFPVNERIRARSVRIVDTNGHQVGVFSTREAIDRARNQGLDLIQVNPGEIPVCRIDDAGKFLFEKKKLQREQARRQRELVVDIKEIQLRPVTDTNDLLVKARKVNDFLKDGDKVKIIVKFKGRERAHKEQGWKIIDEFLSHVDEHKIERPLSDGGRELSMMIASMKSKADLLKEKRDI